MKKNYEKYEFVIFMIFIFIIVEISMTYFYFNKQYRTYISINAIAITSDYIKTYIDNSTLKRIKQSNYFYIDNKKVKYKVINVEKNIMKKDNTKLHEVMIKFKIPKKYKDNDTINISLYGNKKEIYTMFKKSWESDL